MEEYKEIDETQKRKPPFSRIGWAFFAILLVTTLLQILADGILKNLYPELAESKWFNWALSFIPLYFVAIPIGFLILRPIPAEKPERKDIGFGKFATFFLMCFALMYIGNIVGTLVNTLISWFSGTQIINPVYEMLSSSDVYLNMLFAVIAAPVLEELIFRKLLIDRIYIYGEGTAILVSGLMFGLFHGNLSQFFYAFALGSMLAYIYLRTGRIRYTILIHMLINFCGGIVPFLVLDNLDIEEISKLAESDPQAIVAYAMNHLPQFLGVGIYITVVFALFAAGLILLIERRNRVVLYPTEFQIEKSERFKKVFLNAGMILFILMELAIMAFVALSN